MPTCRSWISTAPSTKGPNNNSVNSVKPTNTKTGVTTPVAPNMTFVVIPNSDVAERARGLSPCASATQLYWGERGSRTRGARGSPFQGPTRLADGLGLESDLAEGSPRPAPHPELSLRDWFPRAVLQEGKAA